MNIKNKYFYIFLVLVSFVGSSTAMFKPSALKRYGDCLRFLKPQNTTKIFHPNQTSRFVQNNNWFSKQQYMRAGFDWRWALIAGGILSQFLLNGSDDFTKWQEQLGNPRFAINQETQKILATEIGQRALINFVLTTPVTSIKNDQILALINKLIKSNPEICSQFASFSVDNYERLMNSKQGEAFLINVLGNSSEVCHAFLSKRHRLYIDYWPERYVECLLHLSKVNKQVAEKIITAVYERLDVAYRTDNEDTDQWFKVIPFLSDLPQEILENMLREGSPLRELFIQFFSKNVGSILLQADFDVISLDILTQKDSPMSKLFAQVCIENLPQVLYYKSGRKAARKFYEINNDFRQRLDEKINHISGEDKLYKPSQFYSLCKTIPCKQSLLKKINEALNSEDASFEDIFRKIAYLGSCTEERELNPLTVTENHLLYNLKDTLDFCEANSCEYLPKYFDAVKMKKMDLKLHDKIRELEECGYITFVHGQRIENLLVEEWFTKLQSLKEKKPTSDFLYAHVKKLDKNKSEEQELRERLVKNGLTKKCKALEDRFRLLFLNSALFGNVSNVGSCTRFWTLTNNNAGPRYVILKDAFQYCCYEKIYEMFEYELKELENEFSAISDYGNTLLIAVPKDQLSKCVFSATRSGYIREIKIEGIRKTSDIDIIMHTLKHEPHKIKNSDKIEFCLVMTQDEHGGLNPESGIKIFPFVAPKDDQQYAQFKRKENELWQRIEDEIRRFDDAAPANFNLIVNRIF